MEIDRCREWQPLYVRSCSDGVVFQGTWNGRKGLWLARKSGAPTLIDEGKFENPVITRDCRYVVAVESDDDQLQLFDLQAKTRKSLDAPEGLKPWMTVPETTDVLLVCRRQGCADLLLDPSTGITRAAPEMEDGLTFQPERPLQSAGSPHLYWTTRVDYEKGITEIGVLDTRDFSFKARGVFPAIDLKPRQVWIDAANGWAYLASGDLLHVPLPAAANQPEAN